MKNKILIILVFVSLLLAGCSIIPPKKPSKQPEKINELKSSFALQINQSLKNNFTIEEIANPNLIFSPDINGGQVKKYFKLDNMLFALVLRDSMNVILPSLPTDFTTTFVGILAAKQGDAQWSKLIEIKDVRESDKNNPYYLTVADQKLLLTVVDQDGAGSGEGIMKVFILSEAGIWELSNCYYFGGSYSNSTTDEDYFASSIKFSKQNPWPIETCNNAQLISSQ